MEDIIWMLGIHIFYVCIVGGNGDQQCLSANGHMSWVSRGLTYPCLPPIVAHHEACEAET